MTEQRPLYEVVTSQLVIDEASLGELPRVYRLLDELGLSGMLICTPVEFLGGS